MKYLLKRTKKILFVTFFLVQAICIQAQSNTHTGDITVSTQAAVDALNTTLAGKTIIDGNVTIGYTSGSSRSNITDLSNFGNIFRITGNITIQRNGELENINEFANLQTIGGSFYVNRNNKLTALDNFTSLQTIGGYFNVNGNDLLIDIDFPVLQSIGGYFYIRNSQLTTLDFRALQSIRDFFDVQNNSQLTTLDFPSLTSIGTGRTYIYSLGGNTNNVSIAVERNPNLFDCYVLKEFLTGGNHAVSGSIHINDNPTNSGCNSQNEIITSIYTGDITVKTQTAVNTLRATLARKTIINGNLFIGYNDRDEEFERSFITDLTPLSNIVRITGFIGISRNGQLVNLNGLNNLQTIGGDFFVTLSDELTTLGDFPNLQSIGRRFYMAGNDKLTTLGDFPALRFIGETFYVILNDELTTLGNFPVLTSIGIGYVGVPSLRSNDGGDEVDASIVVESNDRLSTCCVLTEFLPGGTHAVSGDIFINDNATGCNSESEINATTLTTTSSNKNIAYNNTNPIAIDFTVGCGASGWTSAITYTPANANFITLSSTGGANQTGAITLMATPTANTGVGRRATIRLSTTGGTGPVSQTVVITQASSPHTLSVSSTPSSTNGSINVSSSRNTVRFTVTPGGGATGWTSTNTGGSFITLNSTRSTSTSATTVTATISGNSTTSSRSGTITFRSTGSGTSISRTITITQASPPHTLSVSSTPSPTNGSINVSSSPTTVSITVDPGGGATGWTSTNTRSDFIFLNSTRSTSTSTRIITATILRNSSTSSRSGTITFRSTGSGSSIIRTITITQASPPHTLSVLSIPSSTNDSININSSSRNVSIRVDPGGGATGWTSTNTGGSFITLNSTGSTSTSATIVTATISRNSSTSSRSGRITFRSTGSGSSISRTITITQAIPPHTLSVSSTPSSTNGRLNINSLSTTVRITVDPGGGATGWTSTNTGSSFISLNSTRSTSTSTRIITATISRNSSTSSRSGTITFRSTGSGPSISKTITITQSPPHTLSVTSTGLQNDSIKVSSSARNVSITVDPGGGATGWTSTSNGGFISLNRSSSSSTSATNVTATISRNSSTSSRSGTITFRSMGSGSSISRTITITQASPPHTLLVNSFPSSTNDSIKVSSSADTVIFIVMHGGGATDWTRTNTGDFFSLDRSGPTIISAYISKSFSTSSRSGTITFTSTGSGPSISKTITITQANPPHTLLVNSSPLSTNSINVSSSSTMVNIKVEHGGGATGWTSTNTESTNNGSFISLSSTESSMTSRVTNITATISENSSMSSRSGTITFTSTGSGPSISRELTITQSPPHTLSVTSTGLQNDSIKISSSSNTVIFTVTPGGGATGWTSTNRSINLIKLNTFGGESTSATTVTADILKNSSTSSRSGRIIFRSTGPGTSVSKTITITQASPPHTLSVSSTPSATNDNININSSFRTVSITVDPGGGATGWTSTNTGSSFISLNSTRSTSTSTTTVTATISRNSSTSSRSGTITFTSTGSGPSISRTITITQAIPPHTLSVSSTPSATNGSINVTSSLDTVSISVDPGGGATGWTSTNTGSSFISLSDSSSSSTSATTVTATISGNSSTSSRSGTITFTSTGSGSSISRTITITQASPPHTLSVSSFPSSTNDSININSSSRDVRITVDPGGGATGWTSTNTGSSFITLRGSSSSSTSETTVTAMISENSSKSRRSGTITFRSTGSGTSISKMITITQAAAPPSLVLSSPSTVTLGYDVVVEQTITFTVGGSATGWASSMSGENFITLTDDGNETGAVVVTATLSGANTGVERSAVITFTTEGGTGDAATATVTITQEAAPPMLTLSSPSTVMLAHDASTAQTIGFTVGGSASGWTSAITGDNFIMLSEDGTMTGDVVVTATPSANTGDARSATITFTTTGGVGDAATATVTITQEAAPTLSVAPSSFRLGHDVEDAQNIVVSVGSSATEWNVTSASAFVEITTSNGGNGDSATFTLSSNDTGSERTAEIVITTEGSLGTAVTKAVRITQEAAPTLTLTSDSTITIGYDVMAEQTITFNVGGSATGWKASAPPEGFVKVTRASGDSSVDSTTFLLLLNETREALTSTITIMTTGRGSPVSKTVTITQEAAPPMLTLSSPSTVMLAHDTSTAQTITFTVGGSATGWASSMSGYNFITLSDDGNVTGDVTVTATLSANTGAARSVMITFMTSGGVGDAATATVTITQAGAPHTLSVSSTPSATNDNININSLSTTVDITVDPGGGTTGWTSTNTGSSFISLSDSSSSSTSATTVTAMISRNSSTSSRFGTIIFTSTGSGTSISKILTITQSPPHTLSVRSDPSATNDNININSLSTTVDITVDPGGGATGWTSTNTGNSFISLSSTRSTSTSTTTVTATILENSDTSSRSGTITFTSTGSGPKINRELTITQSPPHTLSVSSTPSSTNGSINVTSSLDTVSISVDPGGGATGWTSTSNGGFIFLSESSSSSASATTVTATIFTNMDTSSRSGTITFTSTGSGTKISKIITITQEAKPTLNVSTMPVTIGHDSLTSDITFTVGGGAMGWTASSNQDFVTLEDTTGNSGTNISVTATFGSANTTRSKRTATITITTDGSISPAVSKTVMITQEAAPTLTLTSDSTITIGYDVIAKQTITFDVGGSATGWTASSVSTFVTITTSNGGNGDNATFTLSSNDTGSERTAEIVITTEGSVGTAVSETVMITQEEAPTITLSTSAAVDIGYDVTAVQTITFNVGGSATGWTSNIVYSAGTGFITLAPAAMNANQRDEVMLMATPASNIGGAERMATITFSTTGQLGASVTKEVTITQGEAPDAPMLEFTSRTSGDTVKIAYNDSTTVTDIAFTISGNATGWTASSDNNFVTLSSMGASSTDPVTLMATLTGGNRGVERSATITINTTGTDVTQATATLTITQGGAPPMLRVSTMLVDTIGHSEDISHIIFTVGGGAMGWMARSDQTFVTLEDTTGNSGTDTVTATFVDANTTGAARTATIMITTRGGTGDAVTETVMITQEAEPTLSVSTMAADTIGHDSLTSDIIFTVGGGAMGWTASSDQTFVTLEDTTGNSGTNISVTATFGSANTTRLKRTATITITTTGRGTQKDTMVTLMQEMIPEIKVNSINSSTSFPKSISIAYDATDSIPIGFVLGGSAKGWESKISYMPDTANFITLSPDSGMDGEDIEIIMATPSANENTIPRTATITLSTTGHEGTPNSVSLTITQTAIPVLKLTSNDSVNIIHDETDLIPINFYVGGSATGWESNISYTGIISEFITLSPKDSIDQKGDITIMASPSANTDTTSRTATIILSTKGHIPEGASVSDTFTITQKAAPRITLTSPADDGNIDVAHDATDSIPINFFVGGSATGWKSEISYTGTTSNFITLSPKDSIDQKGGITITATPSANENTPPVPRKAIIELITTGPGQTPDSVSLTISQEAMPTIMLSSYNNGDSLLKSDGDTIDIAHNHTNSITIDFMFGGSATGWKNSITDKDKFIDSSLRKDGNDPNIIIHIKDMNTTPVSRTATITLSTTGHLDGGISDSVSLTIRQEGAPVLELTSDDTDAIAHDAIDSIPITFNVGGSATGWESEIRYAPAKDTFITLSPKDSIDQTGPITIMASLMKNTGVERTATITLRTTGQKGDPVSVSLEITQEISPTIELTSYNEGSDNSFLELKSDGRDTIAIAYDATDSTTINFTVGGSATDWESNVIYMPENDTSIMISQNKGTDDNITITPSINTSAAPRTATITLKTAGHEGTPDSVLLTVTQEAIPVLKLTSNDSVNIIHDETDLIPINFYVGGSATGWESDISYTGIISEFITLSPKDSIDQKGDITIMASPSANTDTTSRTATIILSTKGHIPEGASVSDTFTITQKAAPAIMLTDYADGDNVNIAHDDTNSRTISFTLGGSATGWENDIMGDPFISLSSESGTNGNITLTPSANDTTKERTATITLITTGPGQTPDSVSLTITQEAMPTIMLSSYNNGDSLLKSDGDTIDIAHNHTNSITIDFMFGGSAKGWKSSITDKDKFIDSSLKKDGNDPNIIIPIKDMNTTPVSRTATITLSTTGHLDGGISDSVLLTITQEGAPVLELTSGNNISRNPKDTASIPIEFTVGGSATGWESIISYLPPKDTFITLSPKNSIDQTGPITIMASPMKNAGVERTATITLRTTGQKGDPVSVSLEITQEISPTIELTSYNEGSDNSFLELKSDGRDTIAIAYDATDSTTINFTVGGSATDWESNVIYMPENDTSIMISQNKGTDDNITITPSINTSAAPRTATITLKTAGHEGTPDSVLLTVTQEAIPVLKLTSNDSVNIIHDETDLIPINFYVGGSATGWESDISYTGIISEFITLSPKDSIDQKGDITIMASPSANTDTTSRTATIILSTKGHIPEGASVSDTFTITQKAAPAIMLTDYADGDNVNIAHDDTNSRTISFTLGGSATGWENDIMGDPFISLSSESGTNGNITLTPSANDTTKERTATITLITTGPGQTPDSVSLTITQEAMPTIMLSSYNNGDSLLKSDGDTIDIAHNHTNSITIDFMFGGSAKGWKSSITDKDKFIDSSLKKDGNDPNIIIPIKDMNTTPVSRTATITLSTTGHLDGGISDSVLLTITQEGAPVLELTSGNNISRNPKDTASIPIEFTVGGSATGWESIISYLPPKDTFITLSPKNSIDQTGPITIMASPMKNAGVERTATITLRTTGQKGDPVSVSLEITQEISPTIELTSYNEGSDNSFLELKSDGRDTIAIAYDATDSTTINFTVGGSATDWESNVIYMPENDTSIMISQNKGTDDNITITPSINTSAAPRTATITLKTAGHEGTPDSVLLTVTQEAIPVLKLTSNDSVNIIHDETDLIPINFYVGGSATGWESDISYTGIISEFITLSPKDSIDQKGDITIMASPSANTDTTSRTATIILSTKGHIPEGASVSDTFTITQKAAPAIMLTDYADGDNVNIAHDDTNSRTISFTLGGSATGWENDIMGDPFISLSSESGTNGNITLTPSANDTTKERTATITLITTGPGQTPDSVSLTITQEAMPTIMLSSYNNGDSLLKSDGDTIDIAHNHTNSITIDFMFGGSAKGWKSSITDKDKFIDSSLKKDGNDPNIIIPIKDMNTTPVSRTATITLSTTGHLDGGISDSVLLTITQEGAPVLELTSGNNISRNPKDTASIPIEFTVGGSATGWESIISYAPAKDTFITLSPKNSIDQTGPITIMASPMENIDIKERTATITLRTTGQKGDPASVSLEITQTALPNTPMIELISIDSISIDSISIDSISIAHDDTIPKDINFTVGGSAEGWESKITCIPDIPKNNDFIKLNPPQNDAKGSITIEATSSANEDTIPRTATITLSTTGHDGDAVSVSLTITQEAKPVLKLTSNDTDTIAHDAIDSIPINFNVGGSAGGWESEITYTPSDANFVTLSPEESMDQTGPITIVASSMENTDLKKRTATITLRTKGNGASVKDILTITQAAAPEIKLTTSHTNGENIKIAHNDTEPIPLNFTLKGSAEGWTDTIIYTPENADFITIPPDVDHIADETIIKITPSANEDTIPRTATIILKTTGHEGTPDSVSLTITQEAMPVIELISKETDTIIHDATDSIPINFTVGGSATGWESNILYTPRDADFVTLSPKDSITQTGDITIMASPMENADNEKRMATITLSTTGQIGDSASAVFTIIQKAKPTIILRDNNNSSIQKDHTIPIVIRFTVGGSANGWTSHIDYMPDSANFITLNLQKNDDKIGEIEIEATPSANTSVKRTATIILITAGHEGTPDSVSLTITQGGAEPSLGVAPSKPFTLYPNPTNGTLTIEGVTGYLQMYIYDLVGREVMTYSLTPSKKTIDVSDLPSGMYVVTLRGENKTWKEVLMKK